jgi:VanZ family protein
MGEVFEMETEAEVERREKDPIWWRILWYWLPVVVWAGLIYWLSDQPNLQTEWGVWDLVLRKISHFLVFAILTFLIFRVVRVERVFGGRRGWQVVLAVAIAVIYAVLDEFHQSFVPGRVGDYADVLLDFAGILTAGLIIWRAKKP